MHRQLTPEQQAALQRWIDEAQPLMRLDHWVITAKQSVPGDNGSDHEAFAGTFIRDESDYASVHIGDSFWEETPVEQRVTLTHELLHLHVERLTMFTLERLKPRDKATFRRFEHLIIDQLSHIIAPRLPIPVIPPPE